MKSNVQRQETTHETVSDFQLIWPKELDVKPDFTVPVTPTRTARVYKESRKDVENHNGKYETVTVKGYRVIYVINRTGVQPKADLNRYDNHNRNGYWYRTALEVQMAITQYSADNMPSKRSVTTSVHTINQPDE